MNLDGTIGGWSKVVSEAMFNESLTQGSIAPEGNVTAPLGTLYVDTLNSALYLKTTSSGNTGWMTINAGAVTAGANIDLSNLSNIGNNRFNVKENLSNKVIEIDSEHRESEQLYPSNKAVTGFAADRDLSNLNTGAGSDLFADRSLANLNSIGSNRFANKNLSNLDSAGNAKFDAKENVSNKVTTISGTSTDVQYPSAKAVYDYTNPQISTINGTLTQHTNQISTINGTVAQHTTQISSINTELATKVSLTGNQTVSGTKTFSSSPMVPTASAGDNTQKAASTAFVQNAVNSLRGKEDVSNKVNSITSDNAQSTTYYPSVKAVTDYVLERPQIIETYSSGSSWYRVYSDGWKRQGGLIGTSESTDSFPTPRISQDGTPGGTQFAMIESGHNGVREAWKVFNGEATNDQKDTWESSTDPASSLVYIGWYNPNKMRIPTISIRNATYDSNSRRYAITKGFLEWSNDGVNWHEDAPEAVIDNNVSTAWTTWSFNATNPVYSYYKRIRITKVYSSGMYAWVSRITFTGATVQNVVSNTITFLKPFSNTNYTYSLAWRGVDGSGSYVSSYSKNGMTLQSAITGDACWTAEGY